MSIILHAPVIVLLSPRCILLHPFPFTFPSLLCPCSLHLPLFLHITFLSRSSSFSDILRVSLSVAFKYIYPSLTPLSSQLCLSSSFILYCPITAPCWPCPVLCSTDRRLVLYSHCHRHCVLGVSLEIQSLSVELS